MNNKFTLQAILDQKENTYQIKRLFRDILESIRGTEQDFTSGNLGRAVLLLSVPMVLEMAMESVFAIVDIFFVSKLGPDAIATVGVTESIITIIYALAVGLSMAATAMVSRRIGEKKPEKAATAAFQAILTGSVISLLIAVPGLIFAKSLLMLMGLSREMAEQYHGYTSIMLGGNLVIMLLFINNAIFRSAGDAAVSMRVLWFANLLNIILDPCLIFGLGPFPEMGIAGAAAATTIGRGLAVVYQFYMLARGRSRVKLRTENILVVPSVMKKLLSISLGGIGQFIIATSSWIGMVRIISIFGSEVLAGYTIAIRIIVFALLPSFGISNAAATLVGQNLGAKQPQRAERSVWITGFVNIGLLGFLSFFMIFYAENLVRLFMNEQAVVEAGAQCLTIISYGMLAYGLGMVMVNALNGAGDTVTPTRINFFCFWLLEIPLAYLLAITLGVGENGVFYAIVFAESLLTVIAAIIFKRGKWKLKEV